MPHERDPPVPVEDQFCRLTNDVRRQWGLAEVPEDVSGVRLDQSDFEHLTALNFREPFVGRLPPRPRQRSPLCLLKEEEMKV